MCVVTKQGGGDAQNPWTECQRELVLLKAQWCQVHAVNRGATLGASSSSGTSNEGVSALVELRVQWRATKECVDAYADEHGLSQLA
jgi:hypothetical protein